MKRAFSKIKTKQSEKMCDIHHEHMVYMDGHEPFCISCQVEHIEQEKKRHDKLSVTSATKSFLKHASLFDDSDEIEYMFKDFKALEGSTEAQKKLEVRRAAYEYAEKPRKKFNTLLYGKPGAGKTMLAISLLNAISEYKPFTKCLFINISSLFLAIKSSFNDDSSLWREDIAVNRLASADVLVLDDLGSESIMDDSNRSASNYIQQIIYQITNKQHRIVFTTNLTIPQLKKAYNPKIVSRILAGSRGHQIDFSEISDKRWQNV